MSSLPMIAAMFGGVEIVFILLLLPLALAFWGWMLVDCANHEEGSTRIAWLLIILFAWIIGAPLYFFFRRAPRRRQACQPRT